MTSVRGLRQRARVRAGALARGTFPIYLGDRTCLRCWAITGQVSNHVYAVYRRGGALRCGCGGRLWPTHDTYLLSILTSAAITSAAEDQLTQLLTLDANRFYPDEPAGLDLIRNRTGGTPGQGGTAAHDDDLGSQPS
ncbi:hypothetical protein GCM10022254_09130 [Actinomadura meridiana]|uniref:Uncharacterized protein n=1 Tax=Actinomadura meridiana TaxID=559626 RepID=A0ABP8BTW7_9ACTN